MDGENNEFRVPMQMVSNRDRVDQINVVFYGRVSTQHEQQMEAFDNQMDCYKMLLQNHPNWNLVGEYSDRGITGTDAKLRKGFQKMYHDAENSVKNGDGKPFDLIVTREVCRFSRNTVDSLLYVRKYKKQGIEISFFNDGIWSYDSDGELRLTLMSGFAQDEARKTSERVNSGHETCRAKGVLFGNGNILGYDLVRNEDTTKNTYVQNSDADTIRCIYKWYMEGFGEKAIVTKLIEGGYTNTIGKVSWTPSYISRIISNKTYAGYKGYFKSRTTDFLEHSSEKLDEDALMYIKGDWEPIISLEDWEKVQRIRMSKRREGVIGHNRGKGKKQAKDKWCRKLFCDCSIWQRRRICGYSCFRKP